MRKQIASICAAAMLVGMLGAAPASAATYHYGGAQVQNAQFSIQFGSGDRHDRFERRGKYHYYNGHRGSRERRSGWRHHRGYWFPPTAFSFGITIHPRSHHRPARLSRQHVVWCDNRYISYRVSDDTFQPYHGPRQRCISPYSW
jgi:hypothetical protein